MGPRHDPVGLTSTTSPEVPADPNVRRIQPWQIILYWLGPLSPPIHFTILLLWGAMNPPLPAYVLAGCAVLLLYMALRIGLVSSVSKHLGQEREESARVKEQAGFSTSYTTRQSRKCTASR